MRLTDKYRKIGQIGFVLILIMSISFAAIPQRANLIGNVEYGGLINSFIVGIVLMIAVVSVLFMVVRAMRRGDFEATIKTEVYHVLISVVWAIFFIAVALSADVVIKHYMPNGGDMFSITQNYLDKVTCLSSATTLKLEGMKMGAQYLAGMRVRHYAGAWGFSMMAFPGFEIIERALDMILILITPFTSSLFAQGIGLQIIHATAMVIILPAGLVLRIFPVFRDAGSFLIATAFAFYFVFPFCYVINAYVVEDMYQREFGYGICEGYDNRNTEYFTEEGNYFDSMFVQITPSLSQDILYFPTHLSYVAFQAVFLPALNMVMVITFIKAEVKFFSQKME